MKKIRDLFFAICLMSSIYLNAQEVTDAWLGHWVSGIEFAKDPRQYPKAIENYTTAIQALTPNQTTVQLNLINERGNLYLKMLDYQNAIKDFSLVFNHPQATHEQKIEALWGRSKAYLASGRIQEFEKDSHQLEQLEMLMIPIEESKEYAILKVSPYFLEDEKSEERLIQLLMKQKKIQSGQDVTFTPSGWVIIKKAQSEGINRTKNEKSA